MELINEELFKKYSPIKADTDVADFTPYIDIAQTLYINKILGPALLNELETQIKAAQSWPNVTDYIINYDFSELAGTGGNDGLWVGDNVASGQYQGGDYAGDHLFDGFQCLKIGIRDAKGLLFKLSADTGENTVLDFNAGAWDSPTEKKAIKVIIYDNNTGENKIIPILISKGHWQSSRVELPKNTTVNIEIQGYSENRARFFLDNLRVYDLPPYPITDLNKALLLSIAPALSFYATYQGLPFHWASIVNKGVTIRESENSKGVDVNDIAQLRRWIKDDAEVLLKNLITYLCECAVNYPLWTPGSYCGGGCAPKKDNYDFGIYIPRRR